MSQDYRQPGCTGMVLAENAARLDGCANVHQPVPYTAHGMQLEESP